MHLLAIADSPFSSMPDECGRNTTLSRPSSGEPTGGSCAEDVEPGAGDPLVRQRVVERLLVDQDAARRIDEEGADGFISASRSALMKLSFSLVCGMCRLT